MRRASAQLVRIQPGARAVAASENVMRTRASVPAREFTVTFAWRQTCARHSGDVPCVCIFNGRPTCIDVHAQCGSCIHSVLSLRKMRLPRAMYALSLRARMGARKTERTHNFDVATHGSYDQPAIFVFPQI